jgi:2',3'-cyclic-nucleotide 3'-phosphodiesterase
MFKELGASLWLMPPKSHHHIPHPHMPHFPHPHLHHSTDSAKKSHSRNHSHDNTKTHHLDTTLTKLISTTIPSAFPGQQTTLPHFAPHVTLTSNIDLSKLKPSPEKWLEGLAVPQVKDVQVKFREVAVGSTFTKKLFIRCEREGIEGLATLCRWQAVEGGESGVGTERAEKWAETWDPHVSLM